MKSKIIQNIKNLKNLKKLQNTTKGVFYRHNTCQMTKNMFLYKILAKQIYFAQKNEKLSSENILRVLTNLYMQKKKQHQHILLTKNCLNPSKYALKK